MCKMLQIITDLDMLKNPTSDVSVEEGIEIGKQLLSFVLKSQDGIGLAANQVGIDASVCAIVVRNTNPLILVNPRIIHNSEETFLSYESCLSIPGKSAWVKRYKSIVVEADNVFMPLSYDYDPGNELINLELAAIQHELDHLNGITILDIQVDRQVKSEKTYNRNSVVTIQRDDEQRTLKYKKAQPFLKNGWVLI